MGQKPSPRTRFGHDGLNPQDNLGNKVSPHRPRSREAQNLSDRTLRLLSWATKPGGLVQRASVELDEPVAGHPALPAQHVMVG
jgi:hypothetical protein